MRYFMTKVNYLILQSLEELLGMDSGYVLDFSNNSFQRFIKHTIGLDIYDGEGYEAYCSKANKLRQIINTEPILKVVQLIEALINHYENIKLKDNNLSSYDKKIINDIREEIKRAKQIKRTYVIDDDLDVLFQTISTREASFNNMSSDEKLKEIANLIEHLLKKNGKFIYAELDEITMKFIDNDDVTNLRKKLQSFRHSSDESLEERKKFTRYQKEFLIEYGIVACTSIYNYLY